ncbi:MAG: SulP family inorganic anion transporter [Gammaproteobacteria bacterium]|nr:SulP family inorganic anion transporter [Gammaproteobacteria bacterium]MBK8990986.1 SulP family inorganic anion transporter [Gammaproteobacteria bacterium]MBK9467431.1 SulP family inorganic anion transporter [Gammaproteobacteria bacterium]MBP7910303.1 SulP family inorganic anion transporter [Pseudomonadales bacterium]
MSPSSPLSSLVPATSWLARYQRDWLAPDVIAGLTTAAVVIPKAMAYATIAGLPLQVGLYTAFVPLIVYAVLGSSATLSVSTTTTIAILTAAALGEALAAHPGVSLATAAATLTVLVGLMLMLARLLRLGGIARFISDPVLTGFKAGIGLVIVVDQLPKLLGLHIDKSGFLRDLLAIAGHIPEASLPTVLVAVASFAAIALMHRFTPRAPAPLVVVAGAIAASLLLGLADSGVSVVGAIPAGLPAFTLPDRSLLLPLWPAAAGIALMSFTESIAAGRAFHRRGEARIGPDQELLATGVASVAAGFFGAMPCGGGTSQTAVNASAGARTQVAGLVTAAGALATMLFLAPAMGALPYATLAAVVVAYSIGLIDPAEIAAIRRVRLPEFRWAIVALAGVVLLGTLKGILVAVVLSLLSLLYQSSNPPVYAVRRRPGSTDFEPVGEAPMTDPALPGLLIARAEGRIYFGNAQTIGDKLRALIEATAPKVLILDCRAILDFEYTALKGLVDWELSLRQQGIEVWLAALNPEALAQVRRTTLAQTLGERRLFPSLHAAVAAYESDTNTCSQAAAVAGSEDQR